jgi:hypothetical protein
MSLIVSVGVVCIWVVICYTVYRVKKYERPFYRYYYIPQPCIGSLCMPTRMVSVNNTDRDSMGGCLLQLQKNRSTQCADTVTMDAYM